MTLSTFSSRKGQSIVEAMVALGVLTTGFLGMVGLLTQSFVLSRTTSNELKATYLASEGIEVAKNILDNDTYGKNPGGGQANAWGTFGGIDMNGLGSTNAYEVEYDSGEPNAFPLTSIGALHCTPNIGSSLAFLLYDHSTGLYGYTSGAPTIFKRCIEIDKSSNGKEITVSSIVSWSTGPLDQNSVDLEDYFYNWNIGSS